MRKTQISIGMTSSIIAKVEMVSGKIGISKATLLEALAFLELKKRRELDGLSQKELSKIVNSIPMQGLTGAFKEKIKSLPLLVQLDVTAFLYELILIPKAYLKTQKQANLIFRGEEVGYFALGELVTNSEELVLENAKRMKRRIVYLGEKTAPAEEFICLSKLQHLKTMQEYPLFSVVCEKLGLNSDSEVIAFHHTQLRDLIETLKQM